MITIYKTPKRKTGLSKIYIGLFKAQFAKTHAKSRLTVEKSSFERESRILYVVILKKKIPKSRKVPNNWKWIEVSTKRY